MSNEEYNDYDLPSKLSMSVEYFNSVLYEQIPLIVQTIYSCICMKNKLLVCATGENVQPSIAFVHDLNKLIIPDLGTIAAVSLNSDARLISYFQNENYKYKMYTNQFEAYAKDQDLLLVIPNNSSDPNITLALEDLIKIAKEKNKMVILLSCNQNDSALTKHLIKGEDLYLEVGDGTEFVSITQILMILQSILTGIKEFKNN